MDASELSLSDWVQILVYGCVALYVALAIPGLFRGRIASGLVALASWAAVLFTILAGYAYRYELGTVAERIMAVLSPGTTVESGVKEVTVFRRPDGQFVVDARSADAPLSLVLDTGASAVVLRAEEAARLKVPVKRLVYDVEVATANGRTLAADITLPTLSIGSLQQTQVRALVAKPGALHENLLGMSYLSGLESFTIANDKLILRGR